MGRKDEALASSEKAVALRRELAEANPATLRFELAVSLIELGIRLSDVGRDNEALAALQEAAPLYRGGDQGVSHMLLNVSAELTAHQRHEDAAILSQWAATLDRKTGDPRSHAAALLNLSVALERSDRSEEAVAACEQAAVIFHTTGDRQFEAAALTNLSNALLRAERFEEAITASQRAIALQREQEEAGDARPDGKPLYNLACALLATGRVEESISASRQAAATYRDPTSSGRITPRTLTLVQTLQSTGMTGESIGCYAHRPANPSSDHPQGRACDIMFNPTTGRQSPRVGRSATGSSPTKPASE